MAILIELLIFFFFQWSHLLSRKGNSSLVWFSFCVFQYTPYAIHS